MGIFFHTVVGIDIVFTDGVDSDGFQIWTLVDQLTGNTVWNAADDGIRIFFDTKWKKFFYCHHLYILLFSDIAILIMLLL